MSERPQLLRPFRRGICDGDDVWPDSLTDDDLTVIAEIDAQTTANEVGRLTKATEMIGGGAVYSVAERTRHWIGLVRDLEAHHDIHPGEFATEVRCRETVGSWIDSMPEPLQERLNTELLRPLDDRFRLATTNDGGEALAQTVKLADPDERSWRLRRRPIDLPSSWIEPEVEPADLP